MQNQRGQSVIEYMILVAIVAIASIGVVRVLGQTVQSQFATITNQLQGKSKKAHFEQVDEKLYQKRDLGDFFRGAAQRDQE